MKELMQECMKRPAKYLTLAGALLFFIQLGSVALTAAASPYYMSYLRVKLNSDLARYPNTVYVQMIQLVAQASGSAAIGLLVNRFQLQIKHLGIVGSLITGFGLFTFWQVCFLTMCILFLVSVTKLKVRN